MKIASSRRHLARSFALRWDDELRRVDGAQGVAVLAVESESGHWYETPMDHDQLIDYIDKLTQLAASYGPPVASRS